jgi:hypothetical protein
MMDSPDRFIPPTEQQITAFDAFVRTAAGLDPAPGVEAFIGEMDDLIIAFQEEIPGDGGPQILYTQYALQTDHTVAVYRQAEPLANVDFAQQVAEVDSLDIEERLHDAYRTFTGAEGAALQAYIDAMQDTPKGAAGAQRLVDALAADHEERALELNRADANEVAGVLRRARLAFGLPEEE